MCLHVSLTGYWNLFSQSQHCTEHTWRPEPEAMFSVSLSNIHADCILVYTLKSHIYTTSPTVKNCNRAHFLSFAISSPHIIHTCGSQVYCGSFLSVWPFWPRCLELSCHFSLIHNYFSEKYILVSFKSMFMIDMCTVSQLNS